MNPRKNTTQNQGFTLIELMLAIGLLSVLMMVAMPNLSQFVQKQKLASQAEVISSTFSVARSEALNRLKEITVCWHPKSESGNNSSRTYPVVPGKMAVFFLDGSNAEVIREVDYDVTNTLSVDNESDDCVAYTPQGRLKSVGSSGLVFGVCRAEKEKKDSRSITISATGRPMIKKNVDKTGKATIDCT